MVITIVPRTIPLFIDLLMALQILDERGFRFEKEHYQTTLMQRAVEQERVDAILALLSLNTPVNEQLFLDLAARSHSARLMLIDTHLLGYEAGLENEEILRDSLGPKELSDVAYREMTGEAGTGNTCGSICIACERAERSRSL